MSATGPQLKPGDALPGTKYRVVKSLGAGGMGVVYQVVKPPNIQGVLKLMSAELTRHEEHRLRFFDEVRILAQLDHPNIVKVFDYDALPDGTPFYVMELLSGRTVRDVITTMGRVPPRVAYEITRQLLEALQAAHTHEVPVIHRDIKPENIFLHAPRHGEPVVKLIDFGVSAVADRKHDGSFVGTWSYAAPEQIRGEKPTPATDLYAAGLVLYEMLAGVGPFDHHQDWTKVSEAQISELPAPVSKFAPWVPPSIVALIQTALAKAPRVRPRDAYAFAEQLYELEWASDGKDPHDFTAEGPAMSAAGGGAGAASGGAGVAGAGIAGAGVAGGGASPAGGAGVVGAARAAGGAAGMGGGGQVAGVAAAAVAGAVAAARAGGADAGEPIAVGGNGPLSKVLSTITSTSNAPSKGMAAAVPATDRLGDVPLIGVPPDAVRGGSTWQGVGRQDNTSPGTDTLLAGLGAVAGKPPSKRERESNPDAHSPAPGQVARGDARRATGADDAAPPTPRTPANAQPGVQSGGGVRAATAATLDEILPSSGVNAGPPASRDTFSSQSSDARRALPRSRTGLVALAGALILLGVTAAIVVVTRGSSTSAGGESTGGPAASGAAAASSTAADGTANGSGATNVTGTVSAGAATESGPTANGDAGATGAETTEATPASATGTPNGAGAGASATAGGNIVTTARGVTAPPPAGKSGHAPTGHAKATATGATTAPPTTTPGTNATTPPKPTASGDFIRHF